MGKIAGRNARVILSARDFSCDSNNATLTLSAEAPEVTAFCDDNRTRMQDGIKDSELSVDGFYNSGASNVDIALHSLMAASILTGFYPVGYGASKISYDFMGVLTNYELNFAIEDAGATSFTISGCIPLLRGYQLYQGTISGAGASNLASENFTDGAAGSRYAIVRLLSLTGTTPTFSASIQESSDDSNWTTATAVEGVTPAGAGSPLGASLIYLSSASQYNRAAVTLGGTSPCATFLVSLGNYL